ncbi:MAG: rhomboid family intramembrane serine protease [Pseudomonadota bacterium]
MSFHADGHDESPVNPLPPVVMVLVLVMAAIEGAFMLGARGILGGPDAVGWRLAAIQDYGFSARAVAWMWETGSLRGDFVIRFVTYPFLHAGFTHFIFAAVMLLAMGKFVGERMGQVALLILFFGSCIFGALAYALIVPDAPGLIGAFPGVYGLIGGFTCLLWLRLGEVGAQQAHAFTLIGLLVGIQLVFGLLFGAGADWVADIAGFAAGFGMSFLLLPGAMVRLRDKIRRG